MGRKFQSYLESKVCVKRNRRLVESLDVQVHERAIGFLSQDIHDGHHGGRAQLSSSIVLVDPNGHDVGYGWVMFEYSGGYDCDEGFGVCVDCDSAEAVVFGE